jgi:Protein of unknown function (DUF3551)
MSRNLSFAILASVSALGLMGTASSAPAAQARQDSYCLQGNHSGYPGNCEFSSYQQCMATASGTNEGCGINPMKAYSQRHGRYQNRD